MMESGKDYGVRIIRAYAQFSVGKIIFPDGGLRSDLLKRGFVEAVIPDGHEEQKKKPAARRGE